MQDASPPRALASAILLALLAPFALPIAAHAQQRTLSGVTAPGSSATSARAERAAHAPVIDALDDDAVWQTIEPVSGFRQFVPTENADPMYRTEVKFAYDDRNLYAFIRMYDPHPDSIVALLSRRDVRTPSDQIKIMLDSYHDRRSGYEFAVNPAGVKRDYAMYNDRVEDVSWDGIWDAATRIDSLGWTAEYRIPFSQLRFPEQPTHTFGISVWRDIARTNERDSWPLFRQSQSGIVSQLGDLTGIAGIATPMRLEVAPYLVAKNVAGPAGTGYARDQQFSAGADIKYGLSSNLTLDATINPDFGQVEADPSVVNLTAFETFFDEKRPFFLEGAGIFHCDGACEALFYSRRIGRAPQLRRSSTDPSATTILGAAKLTGRTAHGLSIGLLDAVTQHERGSDGATIEPATNYFAARAQQDFRDGRTGVGLMFTGVHRSLDEHTADVLRRDAYAALLNAHHRFLGGRYELSGFLNASYVAGTDSAIARTQRSSVHYFQRPGSAMAYDPSRTSLLGDAESITVGKVGGGPFRFDLSYERVSPGVEINDIGFLSNVDYQRWNNFIGLQFNRPRYFYRFASFGLSENQSFTTDGVRTSMGLSFTVSTQLKNNWSAFFGYSARNIATSYCTSCTRGGPMVRASPGQSLSVSIEGDPRHAITPSLSIGRSWQPESGSRSWSVSPGVELRASSRFSMSLGPFVSRNIDDTQWKGNFADPLAGATHYTFAHLDQKTVGITSRVNVTATPTLSFQLYAEPFVSSGRYSDWRELARPRAAAYRDRFQPYYRTDSTGARFQPDPGGFNFKELRSNAVLRWEYRPGSALFVVWTQQRGESGADGTFDFQRDYGRLFRTRPDNTFLVKLSYWFSS